MTRKEMQSLNAGAYEYAVGHTTEELLYDILADLETSYVDADRSEAERLSALSLSQKLKYCDSKFGTKVVLEHLNTAFDRALEHGWGRWITDEDLEEEDLEVEI